MAAERFITSALLGARHGFSIRRGGVSTGRYTSLNLGGKWGDAEESVRENRRLLAAEAGFDPAQLATVHQVHGAVCVRADGLSAGELAGRDADALVAAEPGRVVGVYSADCVPILFCDGEGRVAAAHAGWRGTVAGVAAAALEALVAAGARRERVRAALGPSICASCFEVGEEVAARFEAISGAVVRRAGARPRVDLWVANAHLLGDVGMAPERIDARPPCTMCDRARFFSFRRDGDRIGQMLSFIVAG